MKKTKKDLKRIAKKLYEFELECEKAGMDVNTIMSQMELLTENLSLEEMVEVDDLVQKMFDKNS